jgi:hypothetical protein
MRKLLSFYSHPEIGKFQGVTIRFTFFFYASSTREVIIHIRSSVLVVGGYPKIRMVTPNTREREREVYTFKCSNDERGD